MREWRWKFFGGKRASDQMVSAPALQTGDAALENAIRRDLIGLRFQPQIEPASGLVTGVEALARWDGVSSPEQLFARPDAAGLSDR